VVSFLQVFWPNAEHKYHKEKQNVYTIKALEMKQKKTFMFRHRNAGQNHNKMMANKTFGTVER
jgi:hypothetical protein